jgi:hypothetical protein
MEGTCNLTATGLPRGHTSVPGVIARALLQKENIRTVSSKSIDVPCNICILCTLVES